MSHNGRCGCKKNSGCSLIKHNYCRCLVNVRRDNAFSIASVTSVESGVTFRLEPGNHVAIRTDQKLGEVPLDVAAGLRMGRLVGQELIQRRLVVALAPKLSTSSETIT